MIVHWTSFIPTAYVFDKVVTGLVVELWLATGVGCGQLPHVGDQKRAGKKWLDVLAAATISVPACTHFNVKLF